MKWVLSGHNEHHRLELDPLVLVGGLAAEQSACCFGSGSKHLKWPGWRSVNFLDLHVQDELSLGFS